MTLRVYRIVKAKHAGSAFDGEGARRFGGRWNSVGTRVVYAAGSIALAALEMVVHVRRNELLAAYSFFEVLVDEAAIEDLPLASVSPDWRRSPPGPSTQTIGDRWVVRQSSPVLRVPSAVIVEEAVYLLNPAHPDYPGSVQVGSEKRFRFDPRLAR